MLVERPAAVTSLAGRTFAILRSRLGLLVAQTEVEPGITDACLSLDVGGIDLFLDALVVVELALQVAHGVGHEVFGVLLVDVIDRIVAVRAPVLGVHVAGVEAEDLELVVLRPGNDGGRVSLGQIAVGADVLELLKGTFVGPPVILAAAQATHAA